ncbi:MAG TPA: cysteine peptidase family C39 domain-containing protein [Candidatus Nanoarchaeia archaeon]|nr:cysteine peptidase family C39 domain-containing protein [Candidatus Nanoarchaeia archaeon]
MISIFNIGTHRQSTTYSCGPASLKIIFKSYGDKFSEKKLIQETNTSPKEGMFQEECMDFCKEHGYSYFCKYNSCLRDLLRLLQKGFPVLVLYQAWGGGHYSIIYGFKNNRFLLSDPAKDGGYRTIRKDLFLKRWWHEDYGKKRHRWLMVVFPRKR